MFGLLKNKEEESVKVFFGSKQESKEETVERKSPFDGKVVSVVPVCDAEDMKRALKIADAAKENAAKVPLSQRINWLEDVVHTLTQEREAFALVLTDEVAKPIAFSRIEVDRCIETIKITIAELANLHGETIPTDLMPSGKQTMAYFRRDPAGVIGCITPFNFPLNLIAHKIAPALGAGNCVVLKPTPEAPRTAYMFAKAFIDSEYASKDALSVIYGDADVGSALVQSSIP
ncbi:MAG TPA: aldehyde dehydrogenase family protein, partial [Epsilonproteobacteria bacterium]|nr:aldehyde dehydrogenase family protein [Campylobacterota bacterium]